MARTGRDLRGRTAALKEVDIQLDPEGTYEQLESRERPRLGPVPSECPGQSSHSADEPVQQFVNSTSSYLLRSVISGPDAIHQSYGLSPA